MSSGSVTSWVLSENSRRAYALYKRALKTNFDMFLRREGARPKAMMIRNEFESHRNETDPQKIEFLFQRAEYWLELLKGSHNPKISTFFSFGFCF